MRADNSLLSKQVYEFGSFRVDAGERVLERAGRPVPVTPKALDVLIALLDKRGHIVEKEDLMKKVWPGTFVEENNLAFNISVLRKVLGENSASPRYIETVPKRGYRFIGEVVEVPHTVPALNGASAGPSASQFTEKPDIEKPDIVLRRPSRRGLAVAVAAIMAAVSGAAIYLAHASPKLTDRDTVVIADFVNRTGDPVFDETLRQGLAVQLEQSPFLSLVSEGRIRQTLRLMSQAPSARVTPEIAREICERTGSVAVLEGSIAKLGSKYVLGLSAKNCRTGDVLDNQQLQVAGKEAVLDGVSQIARRFRSHAGESLATLRTHDTPLAEATTQSLEALKVYSAAWKVHASRGANAALPLFRRAAEMDPQFALAHASLGRMYADLEQSDRSAASLSRAWQLREHASDREKFFIAANYTLLVTGNLAEARQTGEAWAQAYPRDATPHTMMSGYVNKFPGRYEEAAGQAKKAIELDPDSGIAYYNLAVNNAYMNRFGEAEESLQRAERRGLLIDEIFMLAYDLAFLRNDAAGMERVARWAATRPAGQSWLTNKKAFTLAYSGKVQQAQRLSQSAAAEAQHDGQPERAALWNAGQAVRSGLFGQAAEARAWASAALNLSHGRDVGYGAALALAFAGDSRGAQVIADDLAARFPEDASVRFNYLPVLRAGLALNRGEPAKAVDVLQTAAPFELGLTFSGMGGFYGSLYPIYLRGEAYLALHDGVQAAAEFQKILDHRGIVVSDPIGALARLQLGRALVLAGDRMKAKKAYTDFLTLWKDADAGIPILEQAKAEFAKYFPVAQA